jgi:hypothetical protein
MRRLWAKVPERDLDKCWPFTGSRNPKGYGRIGLGSREEGVALAHRVVAEAAIGQSEQGVRHLCGNAACCNPLHLAYGSQVENEADRLRHGTSNRGERHGMHKLTAGEVAAIELALEHGIFQKDIARRYGITQQTVSDIKCGRTWEWRAA